MWTDDVDDGGGDAGQGHAPPLSITHHLGNWVCVCVHFCFSFPLHPHPTNLMTTLKKLVGQISGAEVHPTN